MIAISVRIDGDEALNRVLDGWTRKIEDWQPAWRQIVLDHRETSMLQFVGDGRVDGLSRYAPLSPRYARWKARRYPGRPILTASGRLQRETTGAKTTLTKTRLEIRIPTPYAIFHQRGTSKMPARPVLRLAQNRAQQDRWLDIIVKHAEPPKI